MNTNMVIAYLNTYRDFQIKISRLQTPIIACFYVEWCSQYKRSSEILKGILEKNKYCVVFHINILNNIKLTKEYNIISSPTFIAFYNKKVFWRESGAISTKKFYSFQRAFDNILTIGQAHL